MTVTQGGTCGCCAPASTEQPPEPRTREPDEAICYCPIDGLIDAISKKYAMQIVSIVGATQPVRFKDLEERFPSASTSTLANRLDELVDHGVLERESFDEVPPHVEYRLTSAGDQLQERLQPLLEWVATRPPEEGSSPASG